MSAAASDLERRLTSVLGDLRHEGVVSAYLFGSHAEARAHRESDIDVAILLDWRRLPQRRDRFEAGLDVAGELAARRGDRFEDYTAAVRSLGRDARFAPELVRRLERLPGFRNVVIHEYVALVSRIRSSVTKIPGAAPGPSPQRAKSARWGPRRTGARSEHIGRYVNDEQRSEAGCPAGNMSANF